jgi:hypothetical protein
MQQEHIVYVKLIHFLLGARFSFKSLIVIQPVNKLFTVTEREYSSYSYPDPQLNTECLS